jgi:hypothetical protein
LYVQAAGPTGSTYVPALTTIAYSTTASFAATASLALTASYVENVVRIQSPPPSTSTGSLWYDIDTGNTYVRYNSAWVPVQSNTVNATSASFAITASHAVTASYVKPAGGGTVIIQQTGSWTVPVGSAVYSFTVPQNFSYIMWVRGNIPNGIITWNASCTITNNNVPVVGSQYCWVYSGGGTPLDITSIPNQFVGTVNTIVRTPGSGVTIPTDTFRFTINNTSGATQTVFYGWTQL